MIRRRLWLSGSAVFAMMLGRGAMLAAEMPQMLEHIHQPLERLGRLHGVCWGDGYHACKDSGCRPLADLPPLSYHSIVGSYRSSHPGTIVHKQQSGRTFYDVFDRENAGGCDNDGCDAIGCDGLCRDDMADDRGAVTTIIRGSQVTQFPTAPPARYGYEAYAAKQPTHAPAAPKSSTDRLRLQSTRRQLIQSESERGEVASAFDRPVRIQPDSRPTRPKMMVAESLIDRAVIRPSDTPAAIRPFYPGSTVALDSSPQPAAIEPTVNNLAIAQPQSPPAMASQLDAAVPSNPSNEIPSYAQADAPSPQLSMRNGAMDLPEHWAGMQMPDVEIPAIESPAAGLAEVEVPTVEVPVDEIPGVKLNPKVARPIRIGASTLSTKSSQTRAASRPSRLGMSATEEAGNKAAPRVSIRMAGQRGDGSASAVQQPSVYR